MVAEKDGAWRNDAKIAAGVDDDGDQHPLNCTTTGTLEVDISGTSAPIDVIVDNIVPVSQSGPWTVELATEPTIDIGKVDQGSPNTNSNAWPVEVTDGTNTLGTLAHPLKVDPIGTTTQPISGTVTSNQGTSPWIISGAVTESNIDKSFGTWSYYAGTSGTVTVTVGQRVIGISAHSASGGTMTINGGATITIPANVAFNLEPLGNVVAPTIIFNSTDTYFIEVVS